ncbi:CS-domain-containing protein [Neoconidiobolus thromboides FSU 785]|nr:CS-domain-containing protein [Neoconidiobolus thromboides FSU 785]
MAEKTKSWEFSDGPGYKWRQTLKEVEVVIPLEKGKRARDLNVQIKLKGIKISYKQGDQVLVEGELFNKLNMEESTWSIEDSDLVLSLEKFNPIEWWESVIIGHPKIDVSKIEPENSKLADLDGETRGLVEKMMMENRQREQAESNSDAKKKMEIFKKFKKEHPEMDFSKVDMSKV